MASRISILSNFTKDDEIESCIVKMGGKRQAIDIYKKNTGLTIEAAEAKVKTLRRIFEKSLTGEAEIICNDFKRHVKALNLNLERTDYEVYQPTINADISPEEKIDLYDTVEAKIYQKILANSQVVYQAMENAGLYINYELMYPKYSTDTYTGRSKAKFFNIQGYTADDHIRTPFVGESDLLVIFDWISADIRVASILSNDNNLKEAFEVSDPYSYMSDKINSDSKGKISREECKLYLLKSINSMDWSSDTLSKIYPGLTQWIRNCDRKLNEEDAYLSTLLGKRLYINEAKNKLAVLNGTMQASVAHAMQNTLIQLYKLIPHRLVCDIHDSLVINAPSNPKDITDIINVVTSVMSRPFAGLVEEDYIFPIKVSIGKRWKKWKYFSTVR